MYYENARVSATMLGYEDHGTLTIMLTMEGDGWGQSFGGVALDGPYDDASKSRLPSVHLGRWVAGILTVLEVERWEQVKGCLVRVERREEGGPIVGLGHYCKNKWFRPFA
jgi:hypothetical protein